MIFVVLFTLLRVCATFISPLPLQVDEAQYAGWAHTISAGYFSKPPFIAWLLAAGQQVCSAAGLEAVEGCTRMLQAPAFLMTSLAIMAAAWCLYANVAVSLAAGVLFMTLPLSGFYAQVASTDAWLIFWWALALWAFTMTQKCSMFSVAAQSWSGNSRSMPVPCDKPVSAQGDLGWWLLCGFFIGMGMLTKYSMGLFAVSLLSYILIVEFKRGSPVSAYLRALLQARLWLCAGVALLVFLPNLIWNVQNGFPTFQHHLAISQVEQVEATGWQLQHGLASMMAFFGLQFLVFGPICFSSLLMLSFTWCQGQHLRSSHTGIYQSAQTLLLSFVWPMLGLIMLQAFLSRAHANWALPAYVAATILLAACWWSSSTGALNKQSIQKYLGMRWTFFVSVLIGVMFTLICMSLPVAIGKGWLPAMVETSFIHKISGWREYAGWARQQAVVLARGESGQAQKLPLRVIAEDRELLASLSIYAWPEVERPLAWNPYRRKQNHYQWFYDLADAKLAKDETLLVLLVDEAGLDLDYSAMRARKISQLQRSFRHVKVLDDVSLARLRLGRAQGRAHAFLVKDFKGYP